jgi:hypothetical protein
MSSGQTRSTDVPVLHIAHLSPCCYGMAKAWWVTGWTMSRRFRLISRSDADPRYSAARPSVCSWIRSIRARGGSIWSSRRPRLRIGRCWSVSSVTCRSPLISHASSLVTIGYTTRHVTVFEVTGRGHTVPRRALRPPSLMEEITSIARPKSMVQVHAVSCRPLTTISRNPYPICIILPMW